MLSFFQKIEPLFTMLGAIAAVVSMLIALAPGPIADSIRLYGAEAIAPDGYEVVPFELETIPENTRFIRSRGGTALLTQKEITFSVDSTHTIERRINSTKVLINGEPEHLQIGENHPVPDTDCFIWLYHIDQTKQRFSYELKCS